MSEDFKVPIIRDIPEDVDTVVVAVLNNDADSPDSSCPDYDDMDRDSELSEGCNPGKRAKTKESIMELKNINETTFNIIISYGREYTEEELLYILNNIKVPVKIHVDAISTLISTRRSLVLELITGKYSKCISNIEAELMDLYLWYIREYDINSANYVYPFLNRSKCESSYDFMRSLLLDDNNSGGVVSVITGKFRIGTFIVLKGLMRRDSSLLEVIDKYDLSSIFVKVNLGLAGLLIGSSISYAMTTAYRYYINRN